MKNLYFIFVLLLTLGGCKKTPIEPIPIPPTPYTFNLKVEDFYEGPEVTWSKPKANDFIEYRIWASFLNTPIPDKPVVGNNIVLLETRKNIADTLLKIKETYLWGSGVGVEFTEYRIEIIFSNSVSEISRSFKHNDSEILINQFISTAKHSTITKEIYLLNKKGDKLLIFNPKNSSLRSTINATGYPDFGFNQFVTMELNINATTQEAFIIQPKFVDIIDLKTEKIISKIDFSLDTDEYIVNGSSNNEGLLYLSTNKNNFIVLNRSNNNTFIKTKGLPTNAYYRVYVMPQKDKLLVIEGGDLYRASIVQLDNTKQKITNIEKTVTTKISDSYGAFPNFILDDNTFLIGQQGYIYDINLNLLGEISSKINNFIVVSESNKIDKDHFMVINYNLISKYKFPSSLIKESKSYDATLPMGIFPLGNEIWVLRTTPQNSKFILSKLKL